MAPAIITDGSSQRDRGDTVVIDRSIPAHRWRYTCPTHPFHTDWVRTNNHILCRGCQRSDAHGEGGGPVEYYEIRDGRTGERIHWSRVEIVERNGRR